MMHKHMEHCAMNFHGKFGFLRDAVHLSNFRQAQPKFVKNSIRIIKRFLCYRMKNALHRSSAFAACMPGQER